MVEGADRFLLAEIDRSVGLRPAFWSRDASSASAYQASIEPNRRRLTHILGLRDQRLPCDALELLATTSHSALVGETSRYQVFSVRWPVVGRMHGEGLLLVPRSTNAIADVVAVPDADQTPESICGLVEGVDESSQFARSLAESGCRVLVPVLIDRQLESRGGRATLTTREFLYRSAFELGRHLIGYEVQKILAAVDWFQHEADGTDRPIALVGWGEGGMLSLYAAALDPRIDVACVSGYFEPRERIWQQPIDRNVFGILEQFGDAELASMVVPRKLIIEAARGPELTLPAGQGGAPAQLATAELQRVKDEFQRAKGLVEKLSEDSIQLTVSEQGDGPYLTRPTLQKVLAELVPHANIADPGPAPSYLGNQEDFPRRARRQMQEMDDHNQWLLRESAYVRDEFMAGLDTSSAAAYQESSQRYRDVFRHEVIGHFDQPLMPPNARSRRTYDTSTWTGYEVVLDVFPDVIAYGILLLPKDLQPGERRPVVVCQHGLEGRPQQVVTGDHSAYHDFAAKLTQRGFITFAPQNLYIFGDRFRTLHARRTRSRRPSFRSSCPSISRSSTGSRPWTAWMPNGLHSTGSRTGGRAPCGFRLWFPNMPFPSVRPTSTNGSGKMRRHAPNTATSGQANTRSSNSIWAAHSTTQRWQP